ncbi:MAG TPA: GDP-fucose synthetase [Cytophagales bacterium]|jgi:GDP-L-fucose synthase|nr:GDP-fucose synthetase [Cytophagales bacterium]
MKDNFWKNKKVLVTGGDGFLGKTVVNKLIQRGIKRENIYIPHFPHDDLRDFNTCLRFTKDIDIVIHLAAKVGGIWYNMKYPGSMVYDNIMMGFQLMEAARINGVEKLVNLGSTCAYPKNAPMPFTEENFWDGYPAEATAPYGLAKKMLSELGKGYLEEYKFNSVFLVPVNLYGPGDNFTEEDAHVIPALIQKFFDAKEQNKPSVEVWGSGKATREFLYVEDAAEAILLGAEFLDDPSPINLGTGVETPIKELVELIARLTNFNGKIVWDTTKPDGTPRRFMNIEKAKKKFGFKAQVQLEKGLETTINWYLENIRTV